MTIYFSECTSADNTSQSIQLLQPSSRFRQAEHSEIILRDEAV